MLFHLFRKLSDDIHLAFVASLAVLCNGHLLRLSTLIMSEITFLLISSFALLLFVSIDRSNRVLRSPLTHLLLLLCVVASFYVRTVGIALWGALCLSLLLGKQWRSA